MGKITTMDLGSNTFRVLNYNCENGEVLGVYERVVGTATNLSVDNTIGEGSLQKIINAIKSAKKEIGFYPHIRAVTTAALRKASNSQTILEKIALKTDIEFEIISGEEEANLTLLAVRNRLEKLGNSVESFVVVDIGGASSEVIVVEGDTVRVKSFDIGIVTYEEHTDVLRSIHHFCSNLNVSSVVATAGTPTTIAALKLGQTYKSYDASVINGESINFEDFEKVKKMLEGADKQTQEHLVGKDRAELVVTGIELFRQILEYLGVSESLVIDDGLREGVALDYCSRDIWA